MRTWPRSRASRPRTPSRRRSRRCASRTARARDRRARPLPIWEIVMVDLRPDVEMMLEYLNAIFCEASSEGYLALRVFRDDKKDAPPIALRSVRFDDPTLSNQLQELGLLAANGEHPRVFCPPACAFKNGNGARTEDVAEGVVLVIELEENPTLGRRKLEKLLGKASLVNASGGEWLSPVTGNHEPKLHLHYRLKATTSTQVEHAKLSEARKLAATYAGGDPTAASIVHPIRIPGSWHVKDREHPRICYIIEKNPDIAIDLRSPGQAARGVPTAATASWLRPAAGADRGRRGGARRHSRHRRPRRMDPDRHGRLRCYRRGRGWIPAVRCVVEKGADEIRRHGESLGLVRPESAGQDRLRHAVL